MFDVQSKPVAHMVAQIRAKQLSIRDSQNFIKGALVKYCEAHPEVTEAEIGSQIVSKLTTYKKCNSDVEEFLKTCSLDDVGFPIKHQKTAFQLDMAVSWAEENASKLVSSIKKGQFYNKMTNQISSDSLPALASFDHDTFWGNENPSVSSILLASVATVCQTPFNMPGAAIAFPFKNANFRLPDKLILNPYIRSDKLSLFGGYQYGGQRDLLQQLLFGPEDCSSSVAKAIYLTNAQVTSLSTAVMKKAFNDPNNEYKLKSVVKLDKDFSDSQLKLIQPGDLYLRASHTAVIASQNEIEAEIFTVQFNRDLESSTSKQEGGGTCNYKLRTVTSDEPVYILRPDIEPLGESCSLNQFLRRIDGKYNAMFPDGPDHSPGDCRIFFES